jgi:hypothetical protein
MDSWVFRKAEEYRQRRHAAQTVREKACELWQDLRTAIRQNVEEYNALYGDEPSRAVEYREAGDEALVRVKSQPDNYVEVRLDRTQGQVMYWPANGGSKIAADMRLFGYLNGSVDPFKLQLDEQGRPFFTHRGSKVDITTASEMVLTPVLFP